MNYFEKLLIDRENPYEINLELQIRKILENNTDYTYEFQKNENKYGYDLEAIKYYLNKAKYKRKTIGYIEIEVSENWKDEYVYPNYSFLARKVLVYDFERDRFLRKIKSNGDKTIYLRFNKSLTDCICQSIQFISRLKIKERNLGLDKRENTVLICPKTDKRIVRGIENSMDFVNRSLNIRAKNKRANTVPKG